MKYIIDFLNQLSDRQRILASLLAIIIIGWIDYWAGPEWSTALFYLIPITIAANYPTVSLSYLVSLLCAMTWLISDFASGQTYSNILILCWNVSMRLVLFLFFARIYFTLQKTVGHFQQLANFDSLTGALNRRGFTEKTEEELNRARRFKREFSIAYIDLDNFKAVNDRYGHQVGDQLLKTVVQTMKQHLRVTDLIGRFGGDEFAILFVESTQPQAREAFEKCHSALKLAMLSHGWQLISFSCSVLTFQHFELSLDAMMERADKWMYWVKANGKNQAVYRYGDEQVSTV